jgi:hypothetical protein
VKELPSAALAKLEALGPAIAPGLLGAPPVHRGGRITEIEQAQTAIRAANTTQPPLVVRKISRPPRLARSAKRKLNAASADEPEGPELSEELTQELRDLSSEQQEVRDEMQSVGIRLGRIEELLEDLRAGLCVRNSLHSSGSVVQKPAADTHNPHATCAELTATTSSRQVRDELSAQQQHPALDA